MVFGLWNTTTMVPSYCINQKPLCVASILAVLPVNSFAGNENCQKNGRRGCCCGETQCSDGLGGGCCPSHVYLAMDIVIILATVNKGKSKLV